MSLSRFSTILFAALLALALCTSGAFGAAGHKHRRVHHSKLASLSDNKSKLTISTESPGSGQTLSGAVTWSVKVGGTATRVDFAIDGRVLLSRKSAPYVYGGASGGLDTKSLANGQHTLSATAYGAKGTKATAKVVVNVSNSVAAPNPAPQVPPAPAPNPSPESTPAPESKPAPEQTPGATAKPIYWGATIGSQLTGTQAPWDMNAVSKFEGLAGKQVSMVQFFQPFENCSGGSCSAYAFPTVPLENIRKHGSIPVLSWASEGTGTSDQSAFQLSDVIAGRHDTMIRNFATAAKKWGHPFILRYDWEMNGSWFPWSEGANGNRAGEYVTAWRHVHDIFTSVGADNVTWSWCPNVDFEHKLQGLGSLYPGDAYVDWTGLDGYNWGTNPLKKGSTWRSFDQLFSATYAEITEKIAPSKPMLIGEIGSTEIGGSKAAWISDALRRIPQNYPKIRALLWFDKFDGGMDWPIETSSAASEAFAGGISDPAYLGASFGSLSAAKIAPAS